MKNDMFYVIPSVRNIRNLDEALSKKGEWVLLSNIHIGNLKDVCTRCHRAGKKVIVNHEIVGGLGSDRIAFQFLKKVYGVDCVMGVSNSKLAMAKREGLITIRRIALSDSLSLDQMLRSIADSKEDMIEIRPVYYAIKYIDRFREIKDCPYIAGGFVETEETVEQVKMSGFKGLTTSKQELW